MKNTTIIFLITAIVLLVGGFVYANGKNNTTANVIVDERKIISGETQKIILSQEGYNYNDVTVVADKPISLSADSSVSGCLRSTVFTINGKKYSKFLKTPEDTLELPALSKGVYNFACSMGMGYGKLIVQ